MPIDASPAAERPRRFWSGLQARIFLTFGLIVIGLVTGTVIFVARRQSESLLRETRERGFAIARSIAWLSTPSLLSYNYIALSQAASRSLVDGAISYVVIYDKEGQIAADSRDRNAFGHPPRDRADAVAHAAREEDWQILDSTTGAKPNLLEVTVPVYVSGNAVKWGTVRVGLALDEVYAEQEKTTRSLILAGMVASILCLIGARLAAQGITRPVAKLVTATRAIARGDYSQRLDLKSGDELETLAWNFDRMADEVQRQRAEILASQENLERLNQSLEVAVQTRTHALAESEAKYRILVDSSPLGIVIVQGGRAVFVNPAFEHMTGRSGGDLLAGGFDVLSLFQSDAPGALIEGLTGTGSSSGRIEAQLVGSDGKRIYVEIQTASLLFENAPARMILVSDVSAVRNLQERMARGEKLRALGELAAGVAHDFNNNLGIILGRAQLLQMRVTDPETQAGLDVIRQAAMDGGLTVRRIQQFTRIRDDGAHELLDLPSLAAEVVEITRGKWKYETERRGVQVELRLESDSPLPVLGSRAEIREALTNLIFNSVDALPTGGWITIRSRSERGEAILEVEDNGVGMGEDVKNRMFEPFYTTKGVSGTGLGLSMVYGIVSRHHGSIEVDSTPGVGTRVTMRFPATERGGSVLPKAPRFPAPMSARILVVDDEKELLEVIRDALLASGHRVDAAASGLEGIGKFRAAPYDLVLTDLGMPDVSGWEVARAVRAEGSASVVVGLVTGWGATISEEMVTAHGVDFVMSKPFDVDDLASKVNQALNARASRPRQSASPTGFPPD
jgi:PAS domain S-box-containing protein